MNNRFGPAGRRGLFANTHKNAVLQLIMATGVCFVAIFFTAVCFQAFAHYQYGQAEAEIMPRVAFHVAPHFWKTLWTLPLYAFFEFGFWGWIANAIWIYTWGSLVQMFLGYRQVIPLFLTAAITGALAALLASFFPGVVGTNYLMGARGGIVGLMAAAVLLSPNYKFWITSTFALNIKIVAVVFLVLTAMNTPLNAVAGAWLAGGAAGGLLYVFALQKGFSIGDHIYDALESFSQKMTPQDRTPATVRRTAVLQQRAKAERKAETTSARVDRLLEKIHEKGINSLTASEQDFLNRQANNTTD